MTCAAGGDDCSFSRRIKFKMKFVAFAVFAIALSLTTADPVPDDDAPERSPEGECPSVDGDFPVFLPDSNDAGVYYMCRAGVPVMMNCPEGLEFNRLENVCDWPKRVSEPAEACPEVDEEVPFIFGDKVSCSTYYVCFAGKPFMAECPQGLLFNGEKRYCDFPNNVRCPSEDPSEED